MKAARALCLFLLMLVFALNYSCESEKPRRKSKSETSKRKNPHKGDEKGITFFELVNNVILIAGALLIVGGGIVVITLIAKGKRKFMVKKFKEIGRSTQALFLVMFDVPVKEGEGQKTVANQELAGLSQDLKRKLEEKEKELINAKAEISELKITNTAQSRELAYKQRELNKSREGALTVRQQTTSEVSTQNPTAPVEQAKAKDYRYAYPPSRGGFISSRLEKSLIQKKTFYRLLIDENNPNTATYFLVEDEQTLKIALNLPDDNLFPAANMMGTGKIEEATKIWTETPGKLVLENNNWKIIHKMTINYS